MDYTDPHDEQFRESPGDTAINGARSRVSKLTVRASKRVVDVTRCLVEPLVCCLSGCAKCGSDGCPRVTGKPRLGYGLM